MSYHRGVLVGLVIVVGIYSHRLRVFGNNPVSVLATFILISNTKIFCKLINTVIYIIYFDYLNIYN